MGCSLLEAYLSPSFLTRMPFMGFFKALTKIKRLNTGKVGGEGEGEREDRRGEGGYVTLFFFFFVFEIVTFEF
jgi:hypothetical protein